MVRYRWILPIPFRISSLAWGNLVPIASKRSAIVIGHDSCSRHCRKDDIPAWRPTKILLLSLPLYLALYHHCTGFLRAFKSQRGVNGSTVISKSGSGNKGWTFVHWILLFPSRHPHNEHCRDQITINENQVRSTGSTLVSARTPERAPKRWALRDALTQAEDDIYNWACYYDNDNYLRTTQIARFMEPTCGPPGSCRPQMGAMNLAIWVGSNWKYVYQTSFSTGPFSFLPSGNNLHYQHHEIISFWLIYTGMQTKKSIKMEIHQSDIVVY